MFRRRTRLSRVPHPLALARRLRLPARGIQQGPWITARGYLHCRVCQGEVSSTAGTLFERTRTPLRLWFLAIWFVTSQKHGVSALGLQRVLGGWAGTTRPGPGLHRLRRAMVRPGRERLNGRGGGR